MHSWAPHLVAHMALREAVILLLAISGPLLQTLGDPRASYFRFRLDPQLSGMMFPSDHLQIFHVVSVVDCVRRCLRLGSTLTVAYSPAAQGGGACACFSYHVTQVSFAFSTSTTSPGTRYFNLCAGSEGTALGSAWLNGPCVSDTDCPVDNSVCYPVTSTCLCTPGYFFSKGSLSCVTDCPQTRLLSTFLEYPDSCKSDEYYDLFNFLYYSLSADGCLYLCSLDLNCMSVNYRHEGSECRFAMATARNSFQLHCDGSYHTHFQRMCL